MSRYENYSIKNNVHWSLYAPISSLSTTIQLNDWQWARFSTDMLATLESVDTTWKVTKREIVLITGISWDTLTVTRKYEPCPASDDANSQSQTSFSFDVWDTINVYITAEHLDIVNDWIKFLETKWNDRMKVLRAISWTSLAIDIMPGNFRCADDNIVYAGTTDQILTDNATNYIMIDGTATLQISTTDRDSRYTRLAKVTTLNWEITDIEDWRLDTIGGNLWGLAIHPLTEKSNPQNTDELVLADSADSYNNKRITYANLVPANKQMNVVLGETISAGNWLGAFYFGTDWKAYASDVSVIGKNKVDWILVEWGNNGDTRRAIIEGFVPYTAQGTNNYVYLDYTTTTSWSWLIDYIEVQRYLGSWNGMDSPVVKTGSYSSRLVPMSWAQWNNYKVNVPLNFCSNSISLASPLNYWGTNTITSTVRVNTSVKSWYKNTSSWFLRSSVCLWKMVPGWFIFKPQRWGFINWLCYSADVQNMYVSQTLTASDKCNGDIRCSFLFVVSSNTSGTYYGTAHIQESLNNSAWLTIKSIDFADCGYGSWLKAWASAWSVDFREWYYYRVLLYGATPYWQVQFWLTEIEYI